MDANEIRARLGLSYDAEVPDELVATPVDDPIKALANAGTFEILESGDHL